MSRSHTGGSGLDPVKRVGSIFLTVGCSLLLAAATAHSQGTVRLYRPIGEVGLTFDGFSTAYGSTDDWARQVFREWLHVRLAGDVLHPRLFNFALGFGPNLVQERWTGGLESPTAGGGRLNLDAAANFLSGAPLSLSFSGFRWTGSSPGRLGAKIDEDRSGFGLRVVYDNTFLPMQLTYSDKSRDVTWRPLAQPSFGVAETIRSLRLTARNSKTTVWLERAAFSDRLGDRDFTSYQANLQHQMRWGKRSRLLSSAQYLDRSGIFANSRLSWSQRIHLQHTWTLASDYDYRIFSLENTGGRNSGWTGSATVTYQARPDLVFAANGQGTASRFTGGEQSFYRVQPRVSYVAALPHGASLRAGLAIGYEWRNRQPTADGWLDVVDERHVVDDTRRFYLREPFIDETSVVVTSADETTLYQVDFDYRLVEAGAQLELFALPGGRLAVGDTLSIDYRHQIVPETDANAVIADFSLALRWHSLNLYHRRSLRDQQSGHDSGSTFGLVNFDYMTTGIAVSLEVPGGILNLSGEHNRRQSDLFDITSYALRSAYSVLLRTDLRGTLEAHTVLRRDGDLTFSQTTANLSADWTVSRRLRLWGSLIGWVWSEDIGRNEELLGGRLGTEYLLGLTSIRLRYERFSWWDGLDRTENRFMLGVARSF